MSSYRICLKVALPMLLALTLQGKIVGFAQTAMSRPSLSIPSPLAANPTAQQQSALQNETAAQNEQILSLIRPQMLQAIQNHAVPTGVFRSWQSIIAKSGATSDAIVNTSATNQQLRFVNGSGVESSVTPLIREYHPTSTASSARATASPAVFAPAALPSFRLVDEDRDGLTDTLCPVRLGSVCTDGGLESSLATAFMPFYYISTGEQQSFATFGNYVPWTVTSLVGTNPPNSYYHVSPLGLATDQSGNQLYAIRIDFFSLWNADGGLVGGGAACFYS